MVENQVKYFDDYIGNTVTIELNIFSKANLMKLQKAPFTIKRNLFKRFCLSKR